MLRALRRRQYRLPDNVIKHLVPYPLTDNGLHVEVLRLDQTIGPGHVVEAFVVGICAGCYGRRLGTSPGEVGHRLVQMHLQKRVQRPLLRGDLAAEGPRLLLELLLLQLGDLFLERAQAFVHLVKRLLPGLFHSCLAFIGPIIAVAVAFCVVLLKLPDFGFKLFLVVPSIVVVLLLRFFCRQAAFLKFGINVVIIVGITLVLLFIVVINAQIIIIRFGSPLFGLLLGYGGLLGLCPAVTGRCKKVFELGILPFDAGFVIVIIRGFHGINVALPIFAKHQFASICQVAELPHLVHVEEIRTLLLVACIRCRASLLLITGAVLFFTRRGLGSCTPGFRFSGNDFAFLLMCLWRICA
mmetsp:Transcript_81237/g.230116  ORF Transcript_81237/g.230116 Transcript_81237/m.230116 type:complete len:354 (-) Transcript_81237:520-1581(-)